MRCSALGSMAILTIVLAGCDYDCYETEIRPDGAALQRRLTCWQVKVKDNHEQIAPLSAEKLARIGKLYPTRQSPPGEKKQVFCGEFTGSTPADVGGAGRYAHFAFSLGSASWYVERFRGDDDPESRLTRRRRAANQLADLVVGWMAAEAGRDPNFARLRQFLDRDLRRDLENIGVYGWIGGMETQGANDAKSEFFVRVAFYLCERGYFAPQDIPSLTRSAESDGRALFAYVQRFFARKMGVADDQPIPASLAFLADPERLTNSLDKFVRSTRLFQERVERWKAASKDHSDAKEQTPRGLLLDLAFGAVAGTDFQLTLRGPRDRLELKLFCGEKPYSTNGRWDEMRSAVTWSKGLASDETLPVVCFALWSSPNRAFQEQHLGRVALTDAKLAQYAVWREALKPEEAVEWERFLASLKPGAALNASLQGFGFSGDPKPRPDNPDKQLSSLADLPRRLILEALDGQKATRE
jgi:hypothetical protein